MSLRYLKNIEIDKKKWDECIKNSPNGLVYGYSWYLDRMAENWDALVEDEYTSVFPLPWKRKYFIKYIYQPFFTQQLGIFSRNNINLEMINRFLNDIPFNFLLINTNLNSSNILLNNSFITRRKNYLLNLSGSYDDILARYSKDLRRTIKNNSIEIIRNISSHKALQLYRLNYSERHENIKDKDYLRLENLFNFMIENRFLEITGLEVDNILSAVEVIPNIDNRIYLLLGAQNEKGRKINGLSILINDAIQKFSNQKIILDFEGSELPNVESFFKKFGAIPEHYFNLKINRLKFWK